MIHTIKINTQRGGGFEFDYMKSESHKFRIQKHWYTVKYVQYEVKTHSQLKREMKVSFSTTAPERLVQGTAGKARPQAVDGNQKGKCD